MMFTALILAFAPIVAGLAAFIVGAILAAFRVAAIEAAAFVPEYTANESAEWAADLSLALDVDAEWCVLADTCLECGCDHATCAAEVCGWIGEYSILPVSFASTRSTIATFRAERAAVDAWIATREHTAEAITPPVPALTSERKLVNRDAFLADAKRAIAAHTARRTLQACYLAAFDREWRETMSEPVSLASEGPTGRAYVALDSLARLAHLRRDTSERETIHAIEDRAYLAALDSAAGIAA